MMRIHACRRPGFSSPHYQLSFRRWQITWGMAKGLTRDDKPRRESGPRPLEDPGHQTLWHTLQWTMGLLVAVRTILWGAPSIFLFSKNTFRILNDPKFGRPLSMLYNWRSDWWLRLDLNKCKDTFLTHMNCLRKIYTFHMTMWNKVIHINFIYRILLFFSQRA